MALRPSPSIAYRTATISSLHRQKGRQLSMLAASNPFPNFSLPNQDNKTISLSDYAGHWLIVYAYPRDDTPGCTVQGKASTASKADFDAAGIKVVGVSADNAASH